MVIERNHPVDYFFPKSIKDACDLKNEYRERARFIAGGTDLFLFMERDGYHPQALIDINRIPVLKDISIDGSTISVGSAVTYNEILNHRPLCDALPFLEKAIRTIGGVQVRNVATLVGNIANASPAADTLPPLYVLKTKVHIANNNCSREMLIEDFILGVRHTDLSSNEMITHVTFEIPKPDYLGVFDKLGLRKAMAISVVSVAVLISFIGEVVGEVKIALGSVAPTIISVPGVDTVLVGRSLNDKVINEVAGITSQVAMPIDDVRGSAEYRKLAVAGMIRRALFDLNRKIKEKEK